MKARKRNSNDGWQEVAYVQLRDSYVLTQAEQMEFENENNVPTTVDWERVRISAAIAAMQAIISQKYDAIDGFCQSLAVDAVEYADALVEQLKKKVS